MTIANTSNGQELSPAARTAVEAVSLPRESEHAFQARQFRQLWEQRRFLIRACAAGLFAATLVAFLIPKRFTSTTRLMPPDSQSTSNMMMMAGLAERAGSGLGALAGDLIGLKSSSALFVGMLQSQTVEDHLVEQFDLQKIYRAKLLEDARRELDENTSIEENRTSGILSIAVTDRNAQRAAALANAYVDQLNSMTVQLSTSAAHRERVFLEGRLVAVDHDLEDAQTQLAQFSSKNNTLDIQQQGKAMLDAAANLAGQLIAAQSELQGLRQIYTDGNSRVRSVNARVEELRKELDKLGGRNDQTLNTAAAKNGLPGADPPGDPSSDASSDMPYPSIRRLPLLGAQYADYYRRAKTQETVYELLTEQYELAKVEEAKETPSVKVLDPGIVPEEKSYPPRLLIMLLGTFLVGAISVVWIVGAARWREIDPRDEHKAFIQEVIATVNARIPWLARNGNHGVRSPDTSDLGSVQPPPDGLSG